MTEEERKRLLTALGEDLEQTLVNDRKYRAHFCYDQFVGLKDEDLKSAAEEAGLLEDCA